MVYFKNVHLKNKHNKRIVTENKNKTPNLSTVEENKTFGQLVCILGQTNKMPKTRLNYKAKAMNVL